MLYDKTQYCIQILDTNMDETSLANQLEQYTIDNPSTGFLVFQVTQDSPQHGVIPVANAKITVIKLLGTDNFVSKVLMTDSDGKTDPLPLLTVNAALSQVPGNVNPYSTYYTSVEAPNFFKTEIFNIPIFENITMIQPINLIPL